MRLSFEWKELWEKIDLPCDWLMNFCVVSTHVGSKKLWNDQASCVLC